MKFNVTITDLIKSRFSCRSYLKQPLEKSQIESINTLLSKIHTGPLGSTLRFKLIAVSLENHDALKGVGTYGNIKNPAGFIAGVVDSSSKNLEDYGFALEKVILQITDMGIGTCWLGGLFTRGSFAEALDMTETEIMPAVVALGKIGDPEQAKKSLIRRLAGSTKRKPLQEIFFRDNFQVSMSEKDAGKFAPLLEIVRWAPSASNKQPWRIVKTDEHWHFFLNRTKGYQSGLAAKLVKMADIQRVDIGIAMCHWELGVNEMGLKGKWVIAEPDVVKPDNLTEYIVSWKRS